MREDAANQLFGRADGQRRVRGNLGGEFAHRAIDVTLTLAVDRLTRTAMSMTRPEAVPALDFLQLGGEYSVSGSVGDRTLNFKARGAAETFRPSGS